MLCLQNSKTLFILRVVPREPSNLFWRMWGLPNPPYRKKSAKKFLKGFLTLTISPIVTIHTNTTDYYQLLQSTIGVAGVLDGSESRESRSGPWQSYLLPPLPITRPMGFGRRAKVTNLCTFSRQLRLQTLIHHSTRALKAHKKPTLDVNFN